MFNFDKTIIINAGTPEDLCSKFENNELMLYRNGNYKKAGITKVQDGKKAGAAAVPGSIDLAGAAGAAGDLVRLCFTLKCSESYAEFATANWGGFKKQYLVEYQGGVANMVAALQAVIDPEIAVVDAAGKVTMSEAYISPVANSEHAVKVTLDAEGNEVETDLLAPGAATIVDSQEGFGTYEYLIRNVAFPTAENLRYAAPDAANRPVPGVLYDQYCFDYEVERENPNGGLSAVGQKIVSKVNVVVYCPAGSTVAGALDSAIA